MPAPTRRCWSGATCNCVVGCAQLPAAGWRAIVVSSDEILFGVANKRDIDAITAMPVANLQTNGRWRPAFVSPMNAAEKATLFVQRRSAQASRPRPSARAGEGGAHVVDQADHHLRAQPPRFLGMQFIISAACPVPPVLITSPAAFIQAARALTRSSNTRTPGRLRPCPGALTWRAGASVDLHQAEQLGDEPGRVAFGETLLVAM